MTATTMLCYVMLCVFGGHSRLLQWMRYFCFALSPQLRLSGPLSLSPRVYGTNWYDDSHLFFFRQCCTISMQIKFCELIRVLQCSFKKLCRVSSLVYFRKLGVIYCYYYYYHSCSWKCGFRVHFKWLSSGLLITVQYVCLR